MASSNAPQTRPTQSLPPTKTEEEKRAAAREARRAENLSVQKGGVYILLPWKRRIYGTENVIPRIHDNNYLWKPFYHLNAYQPPCPSVLRQDITEILKPREIISQPPAKDPIAAAMSDLQAADGWQNRGKRSRVRRYPSAQQPANPDPVKATTTEDSAAEPPQPLQDPLTPALSALQALDGWKTKGRRSRPRTPSSSDLGQVTATDNSATDTQQAIEAPINPAMAALEAVDGWQHQGRRSRPRTRSSQEMSSSPDIELAKTTNDSTANAQQPPTDPIIPAIAALEAVDGLRCQRRQSLLRTGSPMEKSSALDLGKITITDNSGDTAQRPTEAPINPAMAALQAVGGWQSDRKRSRRTLLRQPSSSNPGQVETKDKSRDNLKRQAEPPMIQIAQPTQPLPAQPEVPIAQHLSEPVKDPLIEAMAALEAMNDWQSRGKRARPRIRAPVKQSTSLGLGKAVAKDNHGDNSSGETEDAAIRIVQSAQSAPIQLPVAQPLSIQPRTVKLSPVSSQLVQPLHVETPLVSTPPVFPLPVQSLPVEPPPVLPPPALPSPVVTLPVQAPPVQAPPAQTPPAIPPRVSSLVTKPLLVQPRPAIPPRVTSLAIKPLPVEPAPVEHPSAPCPPAEPSRIQPPETTTPIEKPTANGLPSFRRYCRFRIAKVLKNASKVADAVVDRIR